MASPEFQATGLSCILAEILSVDRCVSPPEYFYCCLRSRSSALRDTKDPASGRRSTTFLEDAGLYQSRHFDGMSGDNRTGRFEQERIACRNSNCRTISGRRNADPFRAIAGPRNRRIPAAKGLQRFLTGGVLVFLVRVDAYRRLIAMLHRYGVAVHLGIMFGFDQDDAGIFRRTAEFLEEASVDVATVSMVVPMPGTPTFRRLSGDGRILTTDWSKYDGKKHCVFQPARMSPAELEAGTEWVARRFYSPASIVRRLGGSRAGIWWNLPRNLGYMLAGLSTRDAATGARNKRVTR